MIQKSIVLSNYIKKLYAGIQGKNSIYYHDETLENGAKDNSYRYSGANYILTESASGYDNIIHTQNSSNGLIRFFCDNQEAYVGASCAYDKQQYYYLSYDASKVRYDTFSKALRKTIEDNYIDEKINNYVCFGYDGNMECPYDNLYRIIGVFDDNVKLIKADYAKSSELGTTGAYFGTYKNYDVNNIFGPNKGSNTKEEVGAYYWNKDGINTWKNTTLNTINLNEIYLNSFSKFWQSKIAMYDWQVGGNTSDKIVNQNAAVSYQNEIVTPSTNIIERQKIGLIYLSDYGFAVDPSIWQTNLNAYNSNDTPMKNWIHGGFDEWSITPTLDSSKALLLDRSGHAHEYGITSAMAIRPCFYLEKNVTIISGDGTINSPYRIK